MHVENILFLFIYFSYSFQQESFLFFMFDVIFFFLFLCVFLASFSFYWRDTNMILKKHSQSSSIFPFFLSLSSSYLQFIFTLSCFLSALSSDCIFTLNKGYIDATNANDCGIQFIRSTEVMRQMVIHFETLYREVYVIFTFFFDFFHVKRNCIIAYFGQSCLWHQLSQPKERFHRVLYSFMWFSFISVISERFLSVFGIYTIFTLNISRNPFFINQTISMDKIPHNNIHYSSWFSQKGKQNLPYQLYSLTIT